MTKSEYKQVEKQFLLVRYLPTFEFWSSRQKYPVIVQARWLYDSRTQKFYTSVDLRPYHKTILLIQGKVTSFSEEDDKDLILDTISFKR